VAAGPVTRALRLSLVSCGAQAAAGAVMLDRAVSSAAGSTPFWTLAVPAATLCGLALGALVARLARRPWRDAAVAEIAVGIALAVAAAVPPTPGSVPAALALTLLAGMSSAAVAFMLRAGGVALGRPAVALAWLAAGAAVAVPLAELVLILALGRTTTLLVASTLAAGSGALLLARQRREGEPPLPPMAQPVLGTGSTSFYAGLAAIGAALVAAVELERQLGSGPYARALLAGAVLLGLGLGAWWVARAPRLFAAGRFVAGFVALALVAYSVFSSLGSTAFSALRWLPFYDHDLALFSGALLVMAALGPALVLGPAGSRHPGAAAAGGFVAVALAAFLGAAPPSARVEPPDADFLGMIGALLHPSPRTGMVIDDGRATARALGAFPGMRSVGRTPVRAARRLCADAKRFDVIAVNGGHLDRDFAAALFTSEQHACLARLLRPGGIVVQRLVLPGIDGPSIRLALGTFALAFAHVQVWASGVDLVLAGSVAPIRVDVDRWRGWLAAPGALQAAVRKHWGVREAGHLFGHYVLDRATLLRALREVDPNTDDAPWLEVRAPRALGLSIPPPIDALWRLKMLAGDIVPPTIRGPSAASVLAAAARGGHLSRVFAAQTAERAVALGGGDDARDALLAALVAMAPKPRGESPARAATDTQDAGENADTLRMPARLHGLRGLIDAGATSADRTR